MKKHWVAAGVIGACAACCVPLLMPMLAGAGLAGFGALGTGLLAGIPLDAIICSAIPLAALAGFAVWAYRRPKAAQEPCACEVSCSTTTCRPAVNATPPVHR